MRRVWAALSLSLIPAPAGANFWDIYAFGAPALGTAGAQTALASDFTAVFYNPAALTNARGAGWGVGFGTSQPSLELRFDKDPAIEALVPEPSSSLTFGTHFSLGAEEQRLVMALAFSLPTRSLLSGQAIDPAVPQWYMYQSLPERIVFVIGLGARPLDWLSLGAGIQVLAGLSGLLDYQLDVVAGRFSKKTVTFDIEPRGAPILGLELRPWSTLRLGAAYRASIATDVDLPVLLNITGIADLAVDTRFTVQYLPHQFVFGASYRLEELGLTVSGDLLIALWGAAPDPSVDSRIDAGGELLEGTGLAGALDTPAPGQERAVDLAFRDVISPRVGLEKELGDFTLRAGYAVKPSPSPVQTSGTNYVDGTAHQLSAGASLRLEEPLGLLSNPISIDAGVSWVWVPSRRHEKIDPGDPVGSFEASGSIWVFVAGFRYLFGEAKLPAPTPPPPAAPESPAAPLPRSPAEPGPER